MDSLSMGLTFSCHPFGLGTSDLRQDILASAPYIFSAFIHRLKSVVFCRFQIKKVSELIHEGNVTRIIVKDETGKVLLELPATVAVLGTLLLPWLAALGVIAGIATRCTLVVVRRG
jgi:hypothetical protein